MATLGRTPCLHWGFSGETMAGWQSTSAISTLELRDLPLSSTTTPPFTGVTALFWPAAVLLLTSIIDKNKVRLT